VGKAAVFPGGRSSCSRERFDSGRKGRFAGFSTTPEQKKRTELKWTGGGKKETRSFEKFLERIRVCNAYFMRGVV